MAEKDVPKSGHDRLKELVQATKLTPVFAAAVAAAAVGGGGGGGGAGGGVAAVGGEGAIGGGRRAVRVTYVI